jgi:Holliday junction resolvase RusA-like endonuclease
VKKYTIHGEPASKANSRRLVTIGGKPRIIKSKKARDYLAAAEPQLSIQDSGKPYEGTVGVTMNIWYRSERPDLDPSLILDALEGHAYVNDRQVREMHLFHGVDRLEPRAMIWVLELPKPKRDRVTIPQTLG